MSFVKVDFIEKESKEAEKNLLWYDSEKKKLFAYRGLKLAFDYRLDKTISPPKNRLLPRVVKAQETVTVKSKKKEDVLRWFKDYSNYNNTSVEMNPHIKNQDSISFEVPEEELGDFCEGLDRGGFRYKAY